jgi:hypothetical protein
VHQEDGLKKVLVGWLYQAGELRKAVRSELEPVGKTQQEPV